MFCLQKKTFNLTNGLTVEVNVIVDVNKFKKID